MQPARSPSLPRWLAILVFLGVAVNIGVIVVGLGERHDVLNAHTARPLITELREQGATEELKVRVVRAIKSRGDDARASNRRGMIAATVSIMTLILVWEVASRRLRNTASDTPHEHRAPGEAIP